ncbi:unnamed protein product, partial [Ectocarpus fasciculatus]
MARKLAAALVTAAAWTSAAAAAAGPAGRRPLVWGLDLGNDNIVMAVASRTGVDVVANDVSGRQTPTAVYFAGDHRLIGEHTTGHAGGDPTNLVHHLKSLLSSSNGDGGKPDEDDAGSNGSSSSSDGSSSSSPSNAASSDSCRSSTSSITTVEPGFFCETRGGRGDGTAAGPVEGTGGGGGLRAVVRHMGRELELGGSEVVSYLLRHCAGVVARDTAGKGDGPAAAATATASSSSPPSSCVVASVPSYFSLRQKRAVLDAASIAGVPMPMVMDEGTAVALAYGILKGGLPPPAAGAGTGTGAGAAAAGARPPLKVTVASFTTSGLTVLGRGCSKGGGTAAAEACVYDRVCRVAREQGIAVEGRPRAEFRLAKALTSAMKTLSANKEARLSVDCIDGDKDLAITLTREEVEEACAGVAEGVSAACREALRSAGMTAEDVEDVELLGGGSYIPLLRRSVEGTFRDRVRRTMSSSESVARGCALAAAQRSSIFKLRPFRVVDSLSRDLHLVWRYDGGDGGDEPTESDEYEDNSSSKGGSADARDTGATSSSRASSSRSWLPSPLRNGKGAGEERRGGGGGAPGG